MEYNFFKDKQLKFCFIQSIYLQQKSYIEYKRAACVFSVRLSTSQTLYKDQASWRSAAQCRPRWSSSEDWRVFGTLWRWCAQLSNATSLPRHPETHVTLVSSVLCCRAKEAEMQLWCSFVPAPLPARPPGCTASWWSRTRCTPCWSLWSTPFHRPSSPAKHHQAESIRCGLCFQNLLMRDWQDLYLSGQPQDEQGETLHDWGVIIKQQWQPC